MTEPPANENEIRGSLVGILTCDFCKKKIYQIALFQEKDGTYFLGLNCLSCGASVTAIKNVQDYAKSALPQRPQ